MIEALAEVFAGVFIAALQAVVAVVAVVGLLVGVLLEFLVLLISQGLGAARERAKQRRNAWADSKQTNPQTMVAESDDPSKASSSQASNTEPNSFDTFQLDRQKIEDTNRKVQAVGLLVLSCFILGFCGYEFWKHRRRKATRDQMATLADRYEAQAKDANTPDPVSGQLVEVDSWGVPLELQFARDLLGASVIIRSLGPDGRVGTLDDLTETRLMFNGVKRAAKEVGKAAAESAKEKAADQLEKAKQGLAEKWKAFQNPNQDDEGVAEESLTGEDGDDAR